MSRTTDILEALHAAGPQTTGQLAEALGYSEQAEASSLSAMLCYLVNNGWAKRHSTVKAEGSRPLTVFAITKEGIYKIDGRVVVQTPAAAAPQSKRKTRAPSTTPPAMATSEVAEIDGFTIERDVPIPTGARGHVSKYGELAIAMKPNDSVALSPSEGKRLTDYMRHKGMKVTIRTLPDGRVRVWKLA